MDSGFRVVRHESAPYPQTAFDICDLTEQETTQLARTLMSIKWSSLPADARTTVVSLYNELTKKLGVASVRGYDDVRLLKEKS